MMIGTRTFSAVMFFILVAGFVATVSSQNRATPFKVPRVRHAEPQVLNPGFELGPAYWKQISDGVAGVVVSLDSGQAQSGRAALQVDCRAMRRLHGDGVFWLATPWLALARGGSFSFSAYVRASTAAKLTLCVFNATSKEGLLSGTQEMKATSREFAVAAEWRQLQFSGTLPPAEKNNYRFALKFTAPVTYWVDEVEVLHNGRPCTVTSDIEVALYTGARPEIVEVSSAAHQVKAFVANHSDRPRKLHLFVKQRASLNDYERVIEEDLQLRPRSLRVENLAVALPFAEVYHLSWECREGGRVVQSGVIRLAAGHNDLPRAPEREPVWGMHLNDNNLDVVLPLLRGAGIRHLRNLVNLHWDTLEPQPGRWQWPDSLMDYLTAQGFVVLGKLAYTPKWALTPAQARGWPTQNKMPADMAQYRRYVQSVVSRYRDRISRWEVWNEPNLPRYFEGTPQQYARLLVSAATEIRKVQPEARIAGFSVAKFFRPETMAFFQAALEDQPGLSIAAVSIHPYMNDAPERVGLVSRLQQVGELFRARRSQAPEFWITEYGFQSATAVNTALAYHPPVRPGMVDELTHAAYLVRTACLSRSAGVTHFFCYAMDSERVKRSPDLFGLLEESWAQGVKPALLAYMTLAQLLGDATFEQHESLSLPEVYLLHFRRSDNRRVSVLWQARGTSRLTLPVSLHGTAVFDLFGNRKEVNSGTALEISGRPLYFLR